MMNEIVRGRVGESETGAGGLGRARMAREIATLASGTVAGLCGSRRHDDIDVYVEQWLLWLEGQGLRRWSCWQDCHEDFTNALASSWGE